MTGRVSGPPGPSPSYVLGRACVELRPQERPSASERDTPEQLRLYLSNFDPRIQGFTGTPEAVAKAAKAYRVYYRKVPQDGGGYTIDHSSAVYLFDADGRFVAPIAYQSPPDRAVHQLQALLAR